MPEKQESIEVSGQDALLHDDAFYEAVGARIADAMKGMSQRELAEMTDTTQTMVSRYLSGKAPVPLVFVARAAMILGVSCHWLILGEGPKGIGEIDWSRIGFVELQAEAARQLAAHQAAMIRIAELFPDKGETMDADQFIKRAIEAGILKQPPTAESGDESNQSESRDRLAAAGEALAKKKRRKGSA